MRVQAVAEAEAEAAPPRHRDHTPRGGRAISAHGLGTRALAFRCPDPSKCFGRAAATAVIHAALDAGARPVDTGDAYCVYPEDLRAGEGLVAEVQMRDEAASLRSAKA